MSDILSRSAGGESEEVVVPALVDVSHDAFTALDRRLHRTDDIEGLSPGGIAVSEVDSKGVSIPSDPTSTSFMKSVAMAMVQEEISATAEGRPNSTVRALEAVGCPVELYMEMAEHPDFQPILDSTLNWMVFMPKRIRAAVAIANSAGEGNVAAAKEVERWRGQLSQETRDLLKRYQEGERGRSQFVQQIELQILELKDLISGFAVVEANEDDIIEEAARKLSDVHKADTEAVVDHRTLFGIDGKNKD